MDIHDVRLFNLRNTADQLGSHAELARQADIDPALLSRLIGSNPTKRIGARIARRIERALGIEPHSLDQHPTEANLSGKLAALSEPQQTLIGKLLNRPIDDESASALSTLVDRL